MVEFQITCDDTAANMADALIALKDRTVINVIDSSIFLARHIASTHLTDFLRMRFCPFAHQLAMVFSMCFIAFSYPCTFLFSFLSGGVGFFFNCIPAILACL